MPVAGKLAPALRRSGHVSRAPGRFAQIEDRTFRRLSSVLRTLPSVLCLLLGLLAAGCSRQEPAATASTAPRLLRLSQRNEPATLDPQLAALPDEFMVLRALLEGLVTPSPDGGLPRPAAATHWDTSADGLVWTFHLRPDGRWSNGDPVTAADFVATIRRALNPSLGAPKARLFYLLRHAEDFHRGRLTDPAVIGADAPDARTLVLTLARPAPQLLAVVASGPWLPVHAATIAKFGDTRESAWARPGNFVGNGPFVLTEWRPHQHLLVQRNPAYADAARVLVDGIRFQIYDSGDTEERAFRAGQVDVTMAVPFSKLASYSAPVLQTQPLAETRGLALNTTRPPLNDPRVRRALALALDRAVLVSQVLRGGQQPAYGFLPPGLGGLPAWDGFAADPEEARRLLAAAGHPGGRDLPVLEVSTWTNTPVLEAIQQMWQHELGVRTAIVQREAKVHLAALAAGDFAVGFVPAIPDYDDPAALLETMTADAPLNYPHWHSADYDVQLTLADRAADATTRLAHTRASEAILLAEMPFVPIYFNTQNYLISPRVRGWHADRLWTRCYLDVQLSE